MSGRGSRGGGGGGLGSGPSVGPLITGTRGCRRGGGGSRGGMAGGLSDLKLLDSERVSFLRGGNGGGLSCSSPINWCKLPHDTDWNLDWGSKTGAKMALPAKLFGSCSMNTKSELADCGGVGVFGEVGRDGGVSGSVSAMLLKVIL